MVKLNPSKANKHEGLGMDCVVYASDDLRCIACLSVYANVDLRSAWTHQHNCRSSSFSQLSGRKRVNKPTGRNEKRQRGEFRRRPNLI